MSGPSIFFSVIFLAWVTQCVLFEISRRDYNRYIKEKTRTVNLWEHLLD